MTETFRTSPALVTTIEIAIGDFDRDGKLDLVVLRDDVAGPGAGGVVLLYRGDGAGHLAAPIQIGAGMNAPILVSDLDGDGRADLVFGNGLLRGNGDGTFQPVRPLPAAACGAIAVGDFDVDGKIDLLLSSCDGRASVFLNRGDLSFERVFDFDDWGIAYATRVGDVDGDGVPDIVVGGESGVGVFYGVGAGAFLPVVWEFGERTWFLELGDLNRDGRMDVVAGLSDGVALVADAFGFLQPTTRLVGLFGPNLVGDFDGDGVADVASLTRGTLYLGNGDGTFVQSRFLPTGYATGIAILDVNKDGKPDLAWMSSSVGFETMAGDGAGGFGSVATSPFPISYYDAFTFADVTGDGVPDAVAITSVYVFQTLSVLPGDGTGRFGNPIQTTVGTNQQFSPPVVADFDGDGNPDVAFRLDRELVVLLGDGTGHFPRSRPPIAIPWCTLRVADLNADGRPDLVLVVTNGGSGGTISTLLNDGTGAFTSGSSVSFDFLTDSILVLDMDADGRPDLLSGSVDKVSFRKGDGSGGFGPPVDTPGLGAGKLVAADFDGDGILDLFSGQVLKGHGDGTFEITGTYPLFPTQLEVAGDATGDGKPDILGSFNGVTALLSNTTCLPRRLFLDAWPPSCGTAGAPFATQPTLRLVDDAGNPLTCETGAVTASLAAGPAGAHLGGATTAPLAGGVATFTNLSIDQPGGGYLVRFDLPGARSTATPAFSQSLPSPSISGPTQMCSGSAARFDGPDADAWTWTLDGNVVGSSRFLTLSAVSVGTHALGLSIRSGACASASSRLLSVSAPVPTPTASSNSPVPLGGALQLNASAIPGGTYRWTGPNGFTSTLRNPTVAVAKEADGGRYTVVATVGTCESIAASTDVVVAPLACAGCAKPSFSPAIPALPLPSPFDQIALADFDRDGATDIVAVNGDVAFLKGDGHGGFASPVISRTAAATRVLAVAIADLDGNGLPDVVTGSDGIWVSRQISPGRFGVAKQVATGYAIVALALVDVNGDGITDVVAAQSGGGGFGIPYSPGRAIVLLGNGDGSFGAPAYVALELGPSALLVRDLNGDGKPDLVVANQISQTVLVFFGDGSGGFTQQATLGLSGPPVALAMGDVTGDGTADLVVGIAGSTPAAVIFQGTASGAFSLVRSVPAVLDTKLVLADLDGDGKPDLVTKKGEVLQVQLGKGSALFAPPASYEVPGALDALAIGDLNGDGVPDAAVGIGAWYVQATRIGLLAGDGKGAFPKITSIELSPWYAESVAVADMNGDGYPDLIASGPLGLTLSLADGRGGYSPPSDLAPAPPFSPNPLIVVDLDGDGVPDVVEIDGAGGKIHVLRGLGNGRVAPPVVTDVGRPMSFLALGDVDGDGRTDLLVGPPLNSSIPPVSLLISDGSLGFRAPIDIPQFVQPAAAAIGDVNGDGKPDVVIADTSTNQRVSVFPWNGSGFSPPVHTPLSGSPQTMALGDFDGDGKLDVVLAVGPLYLYPSQTTLQFLPGNGAGGFGPNRAFGATQNVHSLVAADFNGDARLDLAVLLRDAGTVAVYMGDGHGNFADAAEFATGTASGPLTLVDLDRDGRQDLTFTLPGPSVVRMLLNSNCVPSRLGVTATPACATAGQPLAFDVAVLDDGGNVVPCGTGSVTARLVPGTGAAGAVLSGTTTAAVASGLAHFGDLAIDRDGRRYRIEVSHPLAASAWSAPFSVGAVPTPTISGPPQLCAGTSVWSAPSGYDSYLWTVDGNAFSYARNVTPVFLPAGAHSLGLTVTLERCPSQTSISISNAPPNLTALSPNHGVSQGGTLAALTATCVAPGATVSLGGVAATPWTPPDQPPLQVVTGGHAPGAVDAVVTNPDGQSGALPAGYSYECDTKLPKLTSNSPVCAGGWVSIGAPSYPGATYAWTGPNGFTATTRYVYLPGATPSQSGTYTVTISNVFGCTLPSANATVVVNPSPSSAITAPGSVTAWSTGNTASVPDAGAGASYSWWISSGSATITSGWNSRTVTFDAGVSGTVGLSVNVYGATCGAYGSTTIPIDPKPSTLQTITPCRVIDTRLPDGPRGGPVLPAGSPGRRFPIAGTCGVPADAVAVAANVTVTSPTAPGFLRVYAGSTSSPPTSNLTFGAGQTRAGSSIVMLGSDGSVIVESGQPSGTVHVILDVGGYFR